jgi:hypothetical protein
MHKTLIETDFNFQHKLQKAFHFTVLNWENKLNLCHLNIFDRI